jgi:hypothetical protein
LIFPLPAPGGGQIIISPRRVTYIVDQWQSVDYRVVNYIARFIDAGMSLSLLSENAIHEFNRQHQHRLKTG